MLEDLKKVLKKEKKINFAYLFGSAAKNPKYANDIDIAVYVKEKLPHRRLSRLASQIEKVVKKPAEIIVLNDMPLVFISEVLRGQLIFSKSEKTRIAFETKTLDESLNFNELQKEFEKKRFERYGIR